MYLPIVAIFSLLSFSTALPIELQALRARDEFNVRLEADVSPAFVSPLDKRENTLLTQFFTSLNKTGTGVTLAKAAVRTPVIDDQIVKFVANLIEEKNLTYLLEVADSSGLALDLVLLVLTHYEFIDGLTDFVKYYKGNSNLTSSGSGGGVWVQTHLQPTQLLAEKCPPTLLFPSPIFQQRLSSRKWRQEL